MFAFVAALLGCLMILIAAVQGLYPKALLRQRLYTGATGVWTVFGFMLYHPAGMMRWVPHILSASHLAQGIFALGLIVLGITGACALMGSD